MYVDKNDAEMFDWKPFVERINSAASPVKQGGIRIPDRQIPKGVEAVHRTIKRVNANIGGGK